MNISDFNVEEEFGKVPNFSAIIAAKRRSGKSVLLKDILSKIYKKYESAWVFSDTSHLQVDLFDYVPKEHLVHGYNQELLISIYSNQENYIKRCIEHDKSVDKSKLKYILLIFDDIISAVDPKTKKNIRTSGIFDKLFIEGRHLNISVVVLSQYVGGKWGTNGLARKNTDFFFSFYPNSSYDKEIISSEFLSVKSKKEGSQLIEQITLEPYTVLCVSNYKVAREYPDYVYKYKASMDVPKFMIGSSKEGKLTRDSNHLSRPFKEMPKLANQIYKVNEDGLVDLRFQKDAVRIM